MRQRLAGHEEGTAKVHGLLQIPLLRRQVCDGSGDADTGGVDQDVEPAVLFHVRRDEPRAVLLARDVRRDRMGAELAGGLLEPFHLSCRERQRVALSAEHPRDREPDAR